MGPFRMALCALPLAAALLATPANAATLISTGEPPTSYNAGLGPAQWLGVRLIVEDPTTITGLDALISGGGTLRVGLYGEAGSMPGALLFSETEEVAGGTDWKAISGLAWGLDPGAYWLTFEALSAGFLSMPGVNDPLARYAFTEVGVRPWMYQEGIDFGVRVYGEGSISPGLGISPVPEPATWLVLIAGFGLAGTALRRRQAAMFQNTPI